MTETAPSGNTRPVIEEAARRILATRIEVRDVEENREYIDENWPKFVDEAIAALQAFEPLLAEAWSDGLRAYHWEPSEQIHMQGGGSYTTEKPPTAQSYAKRILSEITGQDDGNG